MPFIEITRQTLADGSTAVVYVPANLVVAAGEPVFWRNLDPNAGHWITKKGAPPTFWFDTPLARFVDGQPADVTDALVVDGTRVDYECSIHREGGSINAPVVVA